MAKLTIVVPSHNRTGWLGRLLKYYSEVECPYAISIADSSAPAAAVRNVELVERYSVALNLRYESYSEGISVFEKLTRAIGEIDTAYTVVCADDDAIIPSTLAECVSFLEAAPDYAIAHGRTIWARAQDPDLPRQPLLTHTYRQRSIELPTPLERLRAHLGDYRPTFYSVHRREDHARALRLAEEASRDDRFVELLASCLTLVRGKSRELDRLYMVRQAHSGSAGRRAPSWSDIRSYDDFGERYQEFHQRLVNELVSEGGERTESEEAVHEGFSAFLARAEPFPLRVNAVTPVRMAKRLATRFIMVVRSARSAVRDVGLRATLRAPRRVLRTARLEAEYDRDSFSVRKLLDVRSEFHAAFLPVYRVFSDFPHGVSVRTDGE